MAYGHQMDSNEAQQKAYAVQAAAGQISGGAGGAPKQPIAERAIQELAMRLESISHLTMRVARVADRIHGSEPQATCAGSADRPQPQALTDKFSALYSAVAEIEMSLRNQVERLENFV